MKKKLKIGFFAFSSCEGCQLVVLELEEKLSEVFEAVEIVSFNLLKHSTSSKTLDVAFVEGAISKKEDIKKLQEIRKKSKLVVALGTCASFGGITSIRDTLPPEIKAKILASLPKPEETVFPIGKFVKIDFSLRGCPIEKNEFYSFLNHLVHGLSPREKNFPVCVECKENENSCVLLKGEFCLGPITAAGCNSLCLNEGVGCDGCRGFCADANQISLKKLLEEKGFSLEEINQRLGKYYFSLGGKIKKPASMEEKNA